MCETLDDASERAYCERHTTPVNARQRLGLNLSRACRQERTHRVSLPRMLKIVEAAPILGLSEQELKDRCRRGEIAASKPGRAWLISEEAIRDHLELYSNMRESA